MIIINLNFTRDVFENYLVFPFKVIFTGSIEQLLCHFVKGEKKLFATRDEITSQLNEVKKKFVKYNDFAQADLSEIISNKKLREAKEFLAHEFRSGIFINDGNMKFSFQPFPVEAQFSTINSFHLIDYNNDGLWDILAGGNFYEVNIQRGRYDASYGILLRNEGGNNFVNIPNRKSGLEIIGQVRDIKKINFKDQEIFLFSKNKSSIQFFQLFASQNSEGHEN